MSVEAITWALKQDAPNSSAKFVLVVMANCANERMECFPSISYLCEATGQNRKTVIANIQRLAKFGFVSDTGRRVGATGSIKAYRLNVEAVPKTGHERAVPKSEHLSDVKQSQKRTEAVPFLDRSSTVFGHKQSQKRDTEPSGTVKEPSGNQNIKTRLSFDAWPSMPDKQILADWYAMRKRLKADVSQTVLNTFAKELALAQAMGFSVDDCLSECVTRNWRGFKAEWMANARASGGNGGRASTHGGFEKLDYSAGINPDGSF